MTREDMIAAIEGEIARLEQVRELLQKSTSQNFTTGGEGAIPGGQKRVLSADARKRIAQAQKRRWAKHRKEAAQAADAK
jgi:hypothetical protein